MPETEMTEMMKKKEEKKERKKREQIILLMIIAAMLGALAGYVLGYHQGAFDGYQLALKQFHVIAADLPRLLP